VEIDLYPIVDPDSGAVIDYWIEKIDRRIDNRTGDDD
jgi:hypothetical protein